MRGIVISYLLCYNNCTPTYPDSYYALIKHSVIIIIAFNLLNVQQNVNYVVTCDRNAIENNHDSNYM